MYYCTLVSVLLYTVIILSLGGGVRYTNEAPRKRCRAPWRMDKAQQRLLSLPSTLWGTPSTLCSIWVKLSKAYSLYPCWPLISLWKPWSFGFRSALQFYQWPQRGRLPTARGEAPPTRSSLLPSITFKLADTHHFCPATVPHQWRTPVRVLSH